MVPVTQSTEHGAAEMVGVLMLVAVFTVAAAVLAMILFSQVGTEKPPAVALSITNESGLIKIYHNGGDNLPMNDTQIYVYSSYGTRTQVVFNGSGTDNTWSVGEVLDYTLPAPALPTKVDVVYTGAQWRGTTGFLIAMLPLGTDSSVQPDLTLHTIVATAGSNGAISPSGNIKVADGSTPTFAFTPDAGYEILNVLVDGSTVGTPTSYTFPAVTQDHTIEVQFVKSAITTYWINVTNSSGGYIQPGNQSVSAGGFLNYTIRSYPSYTIQSVLVDNAPADSTLTYYNSTLAFYNFTGVSANHTLSATFTTIYQPGIVCTYYNDRQMSLPGNTLIHPRVRFANGQANYSSGTPTDMANWPFGYIGQTNNFSVYCRGLLKVEVTDTYTFAVNGCNGYFLNFNNGARVISGNNGTPSSDIVAFSTPQQRSASSVSLTPGYYNISATMWVASGENSVEQGAFGIYYENTSFSSAWMPVSNFNHTPYSLPVAGFTASPLIGTSPHAVNFTDTSVFATRWQWDFGDGSNVSYTENPTHTYTSAGTYTVTQTVYNDYGSDVATRHNYISVGSSYSSGLIATYFYNISWVPPGVSRIDSRIRFSNTWVSLPTYNFWYEPTDQANWPGTTLPSGAAGGTAPFSVTWDGYMRVTSADTYYFNLTSDDGAYLFVDESPVINNGGLHPPTVQFGNIYLTPGYHHIVVQYFDEYQRANCYLLYHGTSSSTWQYVTDVWYMNPTPVAAFTGTPVSGNAPMSVVFTDSSTNHPDTWSWNFGDGNATGSTLQNPVHLYTTPNTYNVTLTVNNVSGGSNTLTKTNYITVSPELSDVNFTATPTRGIAPLAVSFTDLSTNSPTAWNWSFGDGTYSTSKNPSHTYALGNYSVTLTVTNAGGSSSYTRSRYISADPTIVSSVSGSGGTITPSGTNEILYGTNQTYTITNSTGYYLASVYVDGVSAGIVTNKSTTYTFTNVTASHTIVAIFASNPVISTSVTGTGTISPSGSVSVDYGGTQAFTITRGAKYHISDVKVDGTSQGAITSYTFVNVTSTHTISATFDANTPTQIYYEPFTSLSWPYTGWTRSSTNVVLSTTIRNGSSGYSVRDRNTDYFYRTIPTTGYSSIVVQFGWAGAGMEAGDYAQAQYTTDGSTYTSFAQINGARSDTSLTIVTDSTLPTTIEDNGNFGLRWRMYGNNNNDYVYVDDVKVTGIAI